MGEIKSVKVDNWGVFFLQKLQNFFNKTDYCDLTLQFNDNSQLKVHRLVLNACTDYFNILEQTCEMIDDVLVMPQGLQADVVVPIVNFMYTGTLEFELKMYGRLLRTARDMNMTVLLKLLEAHRRTMESNKTQTNQNKITTKALRRVTYAPFTGRIVEERPYNSSNTTSTSTRRTQGTSYKTLQIKPVNQSLFPRSLPETAQIVTKFPHSKTPVKGPSRFECTEDTLPPETFEKSFDNISYESKPLICKEEPEAYDYDNLIRKHETYASPFEQLRRGYTNNNNKRPSSSVSSYESPPEKKPNIQDVKEYAEQQRMRKQIAEEFDDDHEYDDVLDDEFHNDDDDDDYVPPQSVRKQVKQQKQQALQLKLSQQKKNNKTETLQRPTIVVKDSTSTNVNHAKIISEVLRKYPHLVKNNKNIKLKILPQSNNAQKIVIKKEGAEGEENQSDIIAKESKARATITLPAKRALSPVASTSGRQSKTVATQPASTPPRRIDSKTMHSLIALGAENRTGPWLCLRCGVSGRPISIPSYRGFRRHLINVHKEKIDARLCEHCGWRSINNKELCFHMLTEHSVKPTAQYNFPKCELCTEIFIDNETLNHHKEENHPVKKEKQSCIYCTRTFKEELHLFTHMRAFHKERAIEDGVMPMSDDDESDTRFSPSQILDSKIKIISDISLPKSLPVVRRSRTPAAASTTKHSLETEKGTGIIEGTEMNSIHSISGELIETDSSQGPKFVNADGNEMILTAAQREEIISQLDQQHEGIVMVLNQEAFETGTTVETVTEKVTPTVSSEQVGENSMFIVCGQDIISDHGENISSNVDQETVKNKDPLDWDAEDGSNQSGNDTEEKDKKNDENENEIDENKSEAVEDVADKLINMLQSCEEPKLSEKEKLEMEKTRDLKMENDSLEMKLKLLTDWTDDEEDDDNQSQKEKSELEENMSKIESDVNEKDNSKGEILFETIATVEEPEDGSKKESDEKQVETEEIEEKEDNLLEEKDENDLKEDSLEINESEDELKVNESAEVNENDEIDDEENADNIEEIKEDSIENVGQKKESNEKKLEATATEVDENKEKEKKTDDTKKVEKIENSDMITKAELRNIMSDWADDDDDDEEDI